MVSSLKRENRTKLYLVMAVNLTLFYGLLKGPELVAGNWLAAFRDPIQVLPAGLGLILMGIMNSQFSADTKSRIVFLRYKNPLPGCEAFTRYAHSDHRVDLSALEKQHGPLPTDPKAQNVLWYKLYKAVEAEPSVTETQRSFLFARDYACFALIMFFVLGTAAFFLTVPMKAKLVYIMVLFLQFVFAGRAARHDGRRFVSNVLVINSSRLQ